MFPLLLLIAVSSLTCSLGDNTNAIVRAKIETCGGCKLNRLPELKAFINEDFVNYDNTELKLIPGASPELIFLDELDGEVKRIDLQNYNREQCNTILRDHNFQPKQTKVDL